MIQKNEISPADVERMVADFFSRGGKVQTCPPKNLGSKQLRRKLRSETIN